MYFINVSCLCIQDIDRCWKFWKGIAELVYTETCSRFFFNCYLSSPWRGKNSVAELANYCCPSLSHAVTVTCDEMATCWRYASSNSAWFHLTSWTRVSLYPWLPTSGESQEVTVILVHLYGSRLPPYVTIDTIPEKKV